MVEAGHEAQLVYAEDFLAGFLRDCRQCRKPDGECSIDDSFRSRAVSAGPWLHRRAADLLVGTSAQLKAFFDRSFCYYAVSYPTAEVIDGMKGKRIGLVLSSEETFPMVSGAVIGQIQEFTRYTRSTFVGVVHGYGNARGDVLRDPNEPVKAARRLHAACQRLPDRYATLGTRVGLTP